MMRFPLPLRFTVPVILFLLGSIVSAVSIYQQMERTQRQAEELAMRRAEFAGTRLSTMVDYLYRTAQTSTKEIEGANLVISQMNEDGHLQYAILLDESDRTIFANRYELRHKHLSDLPIANLDSQIQQRRQAQSGQVIYDRKTHKLLAIYPIQLQLLPGELKPSRIGMLLLQYDLSEVISQASREALKQSVPNSGMLLVLCMGVWFLFERIVTQRAARLVQVTHGLALGRLGDRVRLSGCDELAQIGSAFNQMADLIQQDTEMLQHKTHLLEQTLADLRSTQAHLIQTEKMSSLGQMVAGIAHEINNPMGFISGNIGYLHDYASSLLNVIALYQQHYPQPGGEIEAAIAETDLDLIVEDLPKLLHSMQSGAERIRQIVLSLRTFSRLDESDMKAIDIHSGLDSTLSILQSRLKPTRQRSDIAIVKRYGVLPQVECYAGQLNQVFFNILNNAIDAIDEQGQHQPFAPQITICTELSGADKTIEIRITDNGSGIAVEVQSRIFDPFFTTKAVGKGTGLGLLTAYQIITEKHRGKITCESAVGQGTTFAIVIPIVQTLSQSLSQNLQ
jgi:signal transduction histidine kinase